ncbi:hypothetical protein PMAYCL1PPCAC_05442, partial [Pristionchus mayeri]
RSRVSGRSRGTSGSGRTGGTRASRHLDRLSCGAGSSIGSRSSGVSSGSRRTGRPGGSRSTSRRIGTRSSGLSIGSSGPGLSCRTSGPGRAIEAEVRRCHGVAASHGRVLSWCSGCSRRSVVSGSTVHSFGAWRTSWSHAARATRSSTSSPSCDSSCSGVTSSACSCDSRIRGSGHGGRRAVRASSSATSISRASGVVGASSSRAESSLVDDASQRLLLIALQLAVVVEGLTLARLATNTAAGLGIRVVRFESLPEPAGSVEAEVDLILDVGVHHRHIVVAHGDGDDCDDDGGSGD